MLASLADLKAHLNIESSTNDAELDDVLDAALDVVRSLIGDIETSSVTETVPVVGGTAILSRRPTGTVLSGGIAVGGTVDAAAGLITGLGPSSWGGYTSRTMTVTYDAGSASVPAAVRLATLIIAGHLYETQRGPASSGGPLAAEDPTFAPGLGYAIPSRARELLEPYVLGPVIA